jgi:hypothetical protein
MSNHTHETVPTQFVEADGTRYAYRRFGKVGTVPLLFRDVDDWPIVATSLLPDRAKKMALPDTFNQRSCPN